MISSLRASNMPKASSQNACSERNSSDSSSSQERPLSSRRSLLIELDSPTSSRPSRRIRSIRVKPRPLGPISETRSSRRLHFFVQVRSRNRSSSSPMAEPISDSIQRSRRHLSARKISVSPSSPSEVAQISPSRISSMAYENRSMIVVVIPSMARSISKPSHV